MKFFLDENFPRPAIAQLVSAGYSASHTLDHFPPGTADDKLFDHAQQAGAIFITTDKDFFHASTRTLRPEKCLVVYHRPQDCAPPNLERQHLRAPLMLPLQPVLWQVVCAPSPITARCSCD